MLVLKAKLPCAICKKPGERRAIEGLPHNGILWRFIHDDGSEAHEWGRYKSFEDLARHKDTNPAEMKCPRCKQHGTISPWREDPTNKPYKYRYTIKHYYNLKSKFLSKQCHIYTQEQRDMVLKKLGRYIAPGLPKTTKAKPKDQDTRLTDHELGMSKIESGNLAESETTG